MKTLFLIFIGMALAATFSNTDASPNIDEPIPYTASVKKLMVEALQDIPVTAKAYGVFDVETGEILFSQNADEILPIASVTKLFTAAAVLDEPDESVVVTNYDVATEGRAGKLEAGQEYMMHELLFPLLLESSNDAATALDRTLETVPFSNFADAAGLSPENRASVTELVAQVDDLYKKAPHIFDITKLKQYIGEYTGWVNNSPVRDLEGYQGGKHGYTEAAGRTLVAIFSEAKLEDHELGYIILGSEDVKADTIALREAVASSVHLE